MVCVRESVKVEVNKETLVSLLLVTFFSRVVVLCGFSFCSIFMVVCKSQVYNFIVFKHVVLEDKYALYCNIYVIICNSVHAPLSSNLAETLL